MQIVIDIPEEDYRHIKEYYEKNDTVEATYSYIYYGTPLPKGHGRLIDADELKKIWHGCKFVGSIDCLVDCRPTIIEADKAERSDKE